MAGVIITTGSLRQRVTLEADLEQRTPRGGTSSTPQAVARRLPARVRATPGVTPVIRGDQIDPRNEYEVVLRYRAGVTTRLQLRYHARGGDRLCAIVSVTDVEPGGRFLRLLCREAA